jgi:hypothetical protein
MTESEPSKFNRRGALRLLMALPVGYAVGEVLPEVGKATDAVTDSAGIQTGNPGLQDLVKKMTGNQSSDAKIPESLRPMVGFQGPIAEELAFRALPSAGITIFEERRAARGEEKIPLTRDQRVDIALKTVNDVMVGTSGYKLSRREMIVGAISTAFFGATHNITPNGIDTKSVPAFQAVAGGILWYVNRKFGLVASSIAHMTNNLKALG